MLLFTSKCTKLLQNYHKTTVYGSFYHMVETTTKLPQNYQKYLNGLLVCAHLNGTFTSEFLDVRVCWTVLHPQGEYVGLSYILKALFTNNRGGCKTVQHCLTYSNIILTSKNSDVNVPLMIAMFFQEPK